MTTKNSSPRVLLFDIETFANLGFIWGKYEQNVIQYEKEWFMLSFAYKWLGAKTTYVKSLPDFKTYNKDKSNDRALVYELWKLFDEADVIIAHNGNSFDIKKANAKFIEHGFPPPSPYQKVDTKLIAKRYFNFNSNKLDDLAKILGLGRKIDTGGFDLWMGCRIGDMASWKKMCTYNKQDVVLLEKIYLKMRGWIAPTRVQNKSMRCSNIDCGSTRLQSRGTEIRAHGLVAPRHQCQECGKWGYGKLVAKESK